MFEMFNESLLLTFAKVTNLVKGFTEDERGVTAIEYGLIAAAMVGIVVGLTNGLDTALEGLFKSIADALAAAKISTGDGV